MIKRLFGEIGKSLNIESLIEMQKYRQARFFIKQSLNAKTSPNIEKVALLMSRLSLCEYRLGNWEESENVLEKLLENIQSEKSGLSSDVAEPLLVATREKLMVHMLTNNLSKAVKLGEKWAFDEKNPSHLARLNFYLGTVEILRENIFEGKDYLYSLLNSRVPLLLLAMAFNNIGVACWWDKFPNYSSLVADEELDEEEEETEYSERIYKSKLSDFSFAVDFFQTALYKLELFGEASGTTALTHQAIYDLEEANLSKDANTRLKYVLELAKIDIFSEEDFQRLSKLMDEGILLKNPLSVIPLFNLAEMLISTAEKKELKNQGISYLHLAFRFLRQLNENPNKASTPLLTKLAVEYRFTFKSLYLRCLTLLSLIDELEPVILIVS